MLYAFEVLQWLQWKVCGRDNNWKFKIKPSPFSLPLSPCPSPVPRYYVVFFSRMQNQVFLNILFILNPFWSFHVLNKHGSWNPKMCKATYGLCKEKCTIAKWREGQRGMGSDCLPEAVELMSSSVYPSDEKQLNTSGWKLRQMAVQHWLGAEAQLKYYSVMIHFISCSTLNE